MLALFFSLLAVAHGYGNLLVNGNFESGSTGWNVGSGCTGHVSTSSWYTWPLYHQGVSGHCSWPSTGQIYQDVNITAYGPFNGDRWTLRLVGYGGAKFSWAGSNFARLECASCATQSSQSATIVNERLFLTLPIVSSSPTVVVRVILSGYYWDDLTLSLVGSNADLVQFGSCEGTFPGPGLPWFTVSGGWGCASYITTSHTNFGDNEFTETRNSAQGEIRQDVSLASLGALIDQRKVHVYTETYLDTQMQVYSCGYFCRTTSVDYAEFFIDALAGNSSVVNSYSYSYQIANTDWQYLIHQDPSFLRVGTRTLRLRFRARKDKLDAGNTQNGGTMDNLQVYYAVLPYSACEGETSTIVLTSASDTISDGPNFYGNNWNCKWRIQSTGPITFTFSSLSLGPGDSIVFYNSDTIGQLPLATFTASTAASAVVSSAGSLSIQFISDNSGNAAGFVGSYTTGTVTRPVITSISPSIATAGSVITITGSQLGSVLNDLDVIFGARDAVVKPTALLSATSLTVQVPTLAATGLVNVSLARLGAPANGPLPKLEYIRTPTITALSPTGGSAGPITVIGRDFQAGLFVGATAPTATFAGNPCTVSGITFDGASVWTLVCAFSTAGLVPESLYNVVVSLGGASSRAAAWSYFNAPVISSVSPVVGRSGDLITITGSGFGNGFDIVVDVTGFTCVLQAATSTQLVCALPPHDLGSTSIRVARMGLQSSPASFTYIGVPQISGVEPVTALPGTSLTISGTNLGSALVPSTVSLVLNTNSIDCTPTVVTGTSVVCTVGSVALPGNYAVVVTWAQAVSNSAGPVSVSAAAAAITSISPLGGGASASLTVQGSNFNSDATVALGSSACPVASLSSTTIVCTVPSGLAQQPYTVSVTSFGATASAAQTFNYVAPRLFSLSPVGGVQGTVITLAGSIGTVVDPARLSITIGSTACPVLVGSASSSGVSCTVPTIAAGLYTVALTHEGVSCPDTFSFTYTSAVHLLSITPGGALANVATQVTITGTQFTSGITVAIGGTPCTSVVVSSATQLTCLAPAIATLGAKTVSALQSGAPISGSLSYSIIAAPSVTAVSPVAALNTAPGTISITGSFGPACDPSQFAVFSRVSAVDTACVHLDVDASCATITCDIQAQASNLVSIVVQRFGIAASGSALSVDLFPQPVLTSATPATLAAGTLLTLAGSGFVSADINVVVTVGGAPCTLSGPPTPTNIVCLVPSTAAPGVAQVVVSHFGVGSSAQTVTIICNEAANFLLNPARTACVTSCPSGYVADLSVAGAHFCSLLPWAVSFVSDLTSLYLTFPKPVTIPNSVSCAALFDDGTLATFGFGPGCIFFDQSTLRVALSSDATVTVGSLLQFRADALFYADDGTPVTGRNPVTEGVHVSPSVTINGPATVGACDGATLVAIASGTGYRSSTIFAWSRVSPNASPLPETTDTLTFDAASLPVGTSVFSVVVTNFLGYSSTAATFSVTKSTAPLPSLTGPNQYDIFTGPPVSVGFTMVRSACDDNTPWLASWASVGATTFTLDPATSNTLQLSVTPSSLTLFDTAYVLQLTVVKAADPTTSITTSVTLYHRHTPLIAAISVPSVIQQGQSIALDGSGSSDPDALAGTLAYSWTCFVCVNGDVSNCPTQCPSFSSLSVNYLIVSSDLLTAGTYRFTLTVSKDVRSSTNTASVRVDPTTPSNIPVTILMQQMNVQNTAVERSRTTTITSQCGTINPSVPLSVTAQWTSQSGVAAVWSVLTGPNSVSTSLVQTALSNDAFGSVVVFQPSDFNNANWYGRNVYIRLTLVSGPTQRGLQEACFRVGVPPAITITSVSQDSAGFRYATTTTSPSGQAQRQTRIFGYNNGASNIFIGSRIVFSGASVFTTGYSVTTCPINDWTPFAYVCANGGAEDGVCNFVSYNTLSANPSYCPTQKRRQSSVPLPGAPTAADDCNLVSPIDAARCAVDLASVGSNRDALSVLAAAATSAAPAPLNPLIYSTMLLDALQLIAENPGSSDDLSSQSSVDAVEAVMESWTAYVPADAMANTFEAVSIVADACPIQRSSLLGHFADLAEFSQLCGAPAAIFSHNGVTAAAIQHSAHTLPPVLTLPSSSSTTGDVVVSLPKATSDTCFGASAMRFDNSDTACRLGVNFPSSSKPIIEIKDLLSTGTVDLEFETTGDQLSCAVWSFADQEWVESGCTTVVGTTSIKCTCPAPISAKKVGAGSSYYTLTAPAAAGISAGGIAGSVIGAIVAVSLAFVGFVAFMRNKLNPFRNDRLDEKELTGV
eukprot:TRINITY_DN280_c0_g1_i1.p1 TRINITY_DN280_c0_g1~~TRINITY_DN280_c0_g1_i1.p1  ORF type:complete len:2280 (-),score=407.72 TRINITY_DN280_c0_g1_i1:84-6878(-)